jgi:hypothetical protein
MSKTPPKRIPTTAKTPSPRKAIMKQATLKEKLKKSSGSAPTLTMYANPAINTEIVLYTKGKNDGFLATYKRYTEGRLDSSAMDAANFTGCLTRRKAGTDNGIMLDERGFWRQLITRHVSESTPDSRAEGLAVLKACFLTREFSQFPPDNIETIDATDEEAPHALDMFLMDADIIKIINEQVNNNDLNMEFYSKFTVFAKTLWSGSNYPAFAKETLGFP